MQCVCIAASPRDAPPGGRGWGEPCMAVLPAHCRHRVLPASVMTLTLCAIWTFKNDCLIFLVKYNVVLGEHGRHPFGESYCRNVSRSVHLTALTHIFSIFW